MADKLEDKPGDKLEDALKALDVKDSKPTTAAASSNTLAVPPDRTLTRYDSGYSDCTSSRKSSAFSEPGSRKESVNSDAGDSLATFEICQGVNILEGIAEDSSEDDTCGSAKDGSARVKPGKSDTTTEEEAQGAVASGNPVKTERSLSLRPVESLPLTEAKRRRASVPARSFRSLPATREKMRQISEAFIGVARTRTFSSPTVIVARGSKGRRFSEVIFKTYLEMPFEMFRVSSLPEIRKKQSVESYQAQRELRIKEAIETNIHLFYKYINWGELFKYLQTARLLNNASSHYLMSKENCSNDKSNYFYYAVLPSMGCEAYSRFYQCLQNETEHAGHSDLEDIIRRALDK